MNRNQPQPQERIRSKGQVTLLHDASPAVSATIRDVGVSTIGILAPDQIAPGSPVRLDSHGHIAEGIVTKCEPEGCEFYLGIDLLADPDDTPPDSLPSTVASHCHPGA